MTNPTAFPPEFLERMHQQLGTEYNDFLQSLNLPSPTSIRINPRKSISKFNNEEKIIWCEAGRYLKERPSFTFDPLFHAGTYYVQEASSMFIEEAWKQINPENANVKVLDMCAAPGGKSTHLLSLMSNESLLVSNEVISNRNKILQQNIIKWGNANCIITQNKTADFASIQNYFDIVLIDAPCSGEGLFRKDKDAIAEWSEKNVATCAVRQKEILQHAYACLKPGGYLIYSTCTFETIENDENIEMLIQLGGESFKLNLPVTYHGIASTQYGYQFYPHKIKGEGFYLSVFKKDGDLNLALEDAVNGSTARSICHPDDRRDLNVSNRLNSTANSGAKPAYFENYLSQPDSFTVHYKNGLTFAIPGSMSGTFGFLEKQLYIRQAGIFMGMQKGKDFLPSHDLALSNHIKHDLPAIELSYEEAIIYLRCETPKIQPEHLGWCVVKYEGFNLGWIKAIQGRINNYFPKDWRILKRA